MISFIICVAAGVFVVGGEAKTYGEFVECRQEVAAKCRTQCASELPEGKRDAAQTCFKKLREIFTTFDTCLKEHQYGPEKDCVKPHVHKGKEHHNQELDIDQDQDNGQDHVDEVKVEAAKKFLQCKHKCFKDRLAKCSEGCKDAKAEDKTAREAFQACSQKMKLQDARKEISACLEKTLVAK